MGHRSMPRKKVDDIFSRLDTRMTDGLDRGTDGTTDVVRQKQIK